MKAFISFVIIAVLAGNAFARGDEDRGGRGMDGGRFGGSQAKDDNSGSRDSGSVKSGDNGSKHQESGESPKISRPQRSNANRVTQPRGQRNFNRGNGVRNTRPATGGNSGTRFSKPQRQNGGNANNAQRNGWNKQGVNNGSNSNNRGVANNRGSAWHSSPVSEQLRKAGVRSYPHPLTERKQFVTTDREHSVIHYPSAGPKGENLRAKVFARTSLSTPAIRTHMSAVVNARFTSQIVGLNVSENRVNHYYWHTGTGFNYCHYYDNWGYHWYGWYIGSNCFWTRYYSNNWWWYDPTYYRWCYWHDGGWWWQDPYHVNTVYVYVNGNYQASPEGGDTTTTMVSPSESSVKVFRSSDSTRMVKVTGNSEDAFLYDTTDNPSFQPIYLASGVKDVKLSNPGNGRPLQIMLTLNDGSFDLFDDQGNPYNGNGDSGGPTGPMN